MNTRPTDLTFLSLYPGDRFTTATDDRLFTKLSDRHAREHSVHSINLKEEGFGYGEDEIVMFPADTPVCYVPIGGPLRVGG
ncbi:hypothetical protein PS627_00624 [Pseudomonas fluorescens]|uniref:hypothetical protein n=1 Tax=Pseudomonas fluorescens TaxID=294 RepID=UPI001255D25C|nr:hypothetical protein [Pseudomonas fluorescens]CAG8863686.1 hypothetical protein PS627_00624 [Pseudomonas fluorescens]VVP70486.1 hypothetical protein PS910_00778 [Pseudomonas fluorescens]